MIIKNLKILIFMTFCSLVIALGLYFDGSSLKKNVAAKNLVPSFNEMLEKIAYIEFVNNQGSSIIEKVDDQWLLTSANNFPANTELLSRFFIQLREAKIIDNKTNREDLHYKLGLDKENRMDLILKSLTGEEIYSLNIGTYNYNIPGTYVKNPNSNQTLIVNSNLSADTADFYWVPTDLINIGKSQIKAVQIYTKNMINLIEEDGVLSHQNLPQGFSKISEDSINEIQNSLSDLQHNGFILRSDLPNSPNFKARYELKNGTILFVNFYDISGGGIYVTFDWNYLNDKIQISKFIDPLLDGDQFQLSTVSLLTEFAYKVPQLFFDNNNLKLRAKSE
jgi:hypothetical protein